MGDLRPLKRSLFRSRRARTLTTLVLLIFVTYNILNSIYGISTSKSKYNKALISVENSKSSSLLQLTKDKYAQQINRLPDDATVREQLAYQFPYDKHSSFPKFLWQTWKVAKSSPDFSKHFAKFTDKWEELNPSYIYRVVPDAVAEDLIANLYRPVPKVLEAYKLLPKTIMKADFFRYLILYARGGVYSDIDTQGLKPIDNWVSANTTIHGAPNTAGLTIGIEADPDRPDWNAHYARRIQFCQWTIQSKPGHPLLGELVAKITEYTLRRAKDGTLKKVVGKDQGADIMNWTGPGIFTDVIFSYFNELLQIDKNTALISQTKPNKYNKNLDVHKDGIDWHFFTLMTQPIVVDDVLVLPITSFSPGQGHMGSKSPSSPEAYVRHMFEGSWKPEAERHVGE